MSMVRTVQPLHMVQAEPSFSILTDIAWYGFSMTTSSFSTAFNDQLNIFRPGTTSEVDVVDSTRAERVTFTNPVTGVTKGLSNPYVRMPKERYNLARSNLRFMSTMRMRWIHRTQRHLLPAYRCRGQDYYCLRDCSEDPQNCAAGDIVMQTAIVFRRVVSANHPVHAVSKTPMERAATVMFV